MKTVVREFKIAFIIMAVIWASIALGIGTKFDTVCVEGRLSESQAQALNQLEWDHCPSYREGNCEAEVNDRVFVGQCSEFLKVVWKPKKWYRVVRDQELPWNY